MTDKHVSNKKLVKMHSNLQKVRVDMSRIRNPVIEVRVHFVEDNNPHEAKKRIKTFSNVIVDHILKEKRNKT